MHSIQLKGQYLATIVRNMFVVTLIHRYNISTNPVSNWTQNKKERGEAISSAQHLSKHTGNRSVPQALVTFRASSVSYTIDGENPQKV